MKVLYKKNYIYRDLYVVEYDDQYLMVYRSSGLNGGRKGRILPFTMLNDNNHSVLGESIGYIYKEFYFDGMYTVHRKHPETFNDNIADFLLELEEFLLDYIPEEESVSDDITVEEIRLLARNINKDMQEVVGDLQPFDWAKI